MKTTSKTALCIAGGIAGISVAAGVWAFAMERVDERCEAEQIKVSDKETTSLERDFSPYALAVHQREKQSGIYERYVKRPQDAALSAVALVALSPVMGVTAALVATKLGRPVIFKQQRPGKEERIFTLYKFRTMTDERDADGNLLPDDQRMTDFGRELRETSLDELPELWNILKGDMAIVGPRPQLVRDMVFMTPEQRQRHSVRPGLTGLAQVNGRNAIGWDNRLRYDLAYVNDITFLGDWKIILQTVGKVFTHADIATEGMETSEDLGDYLLRIGRVSGREYAKLNGLQTIFAYNPTPKPCLPIRILLIICSRPPHRSNTSPGASLTVSTKKAKNDVLKRRGLKKR